MTLISGGLVWRLVYFQIMDSERYIAHGESQRIVAIDVQAQRGSILDRNGGFSFVGSKAFSGGKCRTR